MKRPPHRAFSLLEVLVCLGLLALLLAIVVTRVQPQQASPGGLAQTLLAELNSARMRAISQQTYVGVAFKTDSLYLLEGIRQPTWVRSRQFGGDFPAVNIFLGTWPSAPFTINRPSTGLDPADFDLAGWVAAAPTPSDGLLLFTPSGSVLSNDLPLCNGTYHILIGSSITATPTGQPAGTPLVASPPNYQQLEAIAWPQTLTISPTGAISLAGGMPPGAAVALLNAAAPAVPGAPGPGPSNGPDPVPVIQSVQLYPEAPNPPTGIQGSVRPGEYLELRVFATTTAGRPLTCSWTSKSSSTGGAFTSDVPTPMKWDAGLVGFVSNWIFRPGPQDADGTVYNLTCQVVDDEGRLGVAARDVLLSFNVVVKTTPLIALTENPRNSLYTCNSDGSNFHRLILPGLVPDFPCLGVDETTMLVTGLHQIYSINRDGSDLRALSDPLKGPSVGPVLSPDGSKIAFASWRLPAPGKTQLGNQIYLMPACGEVTPAPGAWNTLCLTPDHSVIWGPPSFNMAGDRICFVGSANGVPNQSAVFTTDLTGSSPPRQLTPYITGNGGQSYTALYSRTPGRPDWVIGMYCQNGTHLFQLPDVDNPNAPLVPRDPEPLAAPGTLALTRDGLSVLYVQALQGIKSAPLTWTKTGTFGQPVLVYPKSNAEELDAW